MPNYSWPPMDKRRIMGQRISRLDGPVKASGRAKYNSDLNPQGLLHATLLTCPHAHAKIKSIDTKPAEQMKGVAAVRVISKEGTEIQWAGTEVVAIQNRLDEMRYVYLNRTAGYADRVLAVDAPLSFKQRLLLTDIKVEHRA